MTLQSPTSSNSSDRPAATDHADGFTVGSVPKVVEIQDLGRRMVRDLEVFLSEALRSSIEPASLLPRRIIGCDGFSCPRCRRSTAGQPSEVESC